MAVSKDETQITWSASNSTSVSNGSNATSDAATLDTASIQASLTVKADNGGTPAAGDTVDVYVLYSTGDPDGASTDEYDTPAPHNRVLTLDTNTNNPDQCTIPISPCAKALKVYVENNASSNSITVSAALYETSA